MSDLVLGIDTSNYKTSVAVVDREGNIVADCRKFLEVKEGQRGLRQSEAFFQHVQNLPALLEEALRSCDVGDIVALSVSSKPRPVEGSYMPVFTAGLSLGQSFALGRQVPLYTFSHQEGHIEAVRRYSPLKDSDDFVSYHFSGGTTEAILVRGGAYEKIGGTLDISFGQLLDRIGVYLGMAFPAGQEMDQIAQKKSGQKLKNRLPKVKVKDGFFNLSGLETKAYSLLGQGLDPEELIWMVFDSIATVMAEMSRYFKERYKVSHFLFAGGVSGSHFIRDYLEKNIGDFAEAVFGEGDLSSDNAVGVALLGGDRYGAESDNR